MVYSFVVEKMFDKIMDLQGYWIKKINQFQMLLTVFFDMRCSSYLIMYNIDMWDSIVTSTKGTISNIFLSHAPLYNGVEKLSDNPHLERIENAILLKCRVN